MYSINSRQKTNGLLKHPKYDITGVLNVYLVEENVSNAILPYKHAVESDDVITIITEGVKP